MSVASAGLPPAARVLGRGDGVGRLARRTQRGQGGRRVLVVALVAAAVAVGVLASAWSATLVRTDVENVLADRLGGADLQVQSGDLLTDPSQQPLSPAQEAWLAAHPPPPDEAAVPVEEPVVVPVDVALDALPDGAVVLRYVHNGLFGYATDGLLVTDLDVADPLGAGTFDTGGREEPLTGSEALASPAWLASVGAEVGDVVPVAGVGEVEVVGTATRAVTRSQEVLVVAPGREITRAGMAEGVRVALPADTDPDVVAGRVESRLPTAQQELGAEVWVSTPDVVTRAGVEAGADDAASVATIAGVVAAGFAVTVAGLVAACAFAVGVRRRLRELGMLGAVGASPGQLARLVRREGLVIGGIGAVVGAGVGLALALGGQPLLERIADRDVVVTLPPLTVVPPMLLGALGAMLAAWWPARTAARVPVVAALAGRVPTGRVPRWLPPASALLAAAGVAWFADAVGGDPDATSAALGSLSVLGAAIVATLGTAGLGLPVLALGGRFADRLPLRGRLALRDAARRRTRSGAAVAALVPLLALPVAAAIVATADWTALDGEMPGPPFVEPPPLATALVMGPEIGGRAVPPDPTVVADVAAVLPTDGEPVAAVQLGIEDGYGAALAVWSPEGTALEDLRGEDLWMLPSAGVGLATAELLAAAGLPADALADGQVLVLPDVLFTVPPAEGGDVAVAMHRTDGSVTTSVLPAVLGPTTAGIPAIGALVTRSTAEELGLVEVGRPVAVPLARPPTHDEVARTWQLTAEQGYVATQASPPFLSTTPGRFLVVALVGLAVLVVVAVVAGMTAALAATESDDDLQRTVALGAEPRLRRSFHGLQAWWHATVAAVLGTALGLVTGHIALDGTDLVADPRTWLAAAFWVLLAPVAIGLLVAACMRSSPVAAPRRRMA